MLQLIRVCTVCIKYRNFYKTWGNNKNQPDTPCIRKGPVQRVEEESPLGINGLTSLLLMVIRINVKLPYLHEYSDILSLSMIVCKMWISPFNYIFILARAQQNQQNGMCTQWRLRSALASAQSDQSSLCTQWVAEDPSFLHAAVKTLIRLGICPGLSEFTGCTCHFVDFVMCWLICLKTTGPSCSKLTTSLVNDSLKF